MLGSAIEQRIKTLIYQFLETLSKQYLLLELQLNLITNRKINPFFLSIARDLNHSNNWGIMRRNCRFDFQ